MPLVALPHTLAWRSKLFVGFVPLESIACYLARRGGSHLLDLHDDLSGSRLRVLALHGLALLERIERNIIKSTMLCAELSVVDGRLPILRNKQPQTGEIVVILVD